MAQKQLQGTQVEEETLDFTGSDGSTLANVNAVSLNGAVAGLTALDIVQLDGAARLPIVSGSQLTDVLHDLIDDTAPELGGNLAVKTFSLFGTDTTGAVNAGAVTLIGGNNDSSGRGGDINLTGGTAVGNGGGAVNITSGASTNSASGHVNIATSTALNNGGDINLLLGSGTASGDIIISSNTATSNFIPQLQFKEATNNGTSHIALRAPISIATSRTWTLPDDDPVASAGFSMVTDASGILSFSDSFVKNTGDSMTGQLDIAYDPALNASMMQIRDTANDVELDIYTELNSGSYNPATIAGDLGIIFRKAAASTGTCFIGPWSTTATGIRIDAVTQEVQTFGQLKNNTTPTDIDDVTRKDYVDKLNLFNMQFLLPIGSNDTYTLLQSASFGFTIDKAYYQTTSGTITGDIKIEGTSVTNLSALSISSTEGNASSTGADTVSVGGKVTIVTTANSTATMVSVMLECTRT